MRSLIGHVLHNLRIENGYFAAHKVFYAENIAKKVFPRMSHLHENNELGLYAAFAETSARLVQDVDNKIGDMFKTTICHTLASETIANENRVQATLEACAGIAALQCEGIAPASQMRSGLQGDQYVEPDRSVGHFKVEIAETCCPIQLNDNRAVYL